MSVATLEVQALGARRRFPKYASYTPSGSDWLGRLPSHWRLSNLGYCASVKARLGWKGLKAEEYVDEGYVLLSTPNIKGRDIDFKNVNHITAERYFESPEIILQPGDVLIAKDGSTLGITNLVRHLPSATTVNSSIAVVRPFANIESGFLYYLLSCHFTQSTIHRMKDGQGVPHLFQADLRKFLVWLPPPEEQQAIHIFLDREMARIDELLAKKERLIELLQEKRKSLINHVITNGSIAGRSLTATGFPWMPKIPDDWTVKRLKHLSPSQTVGIVVNPSSYFEDEGVPCLLGNNIAEGRIKLDGVRFINESSNRVLVKSMLRAGDIVVVRVGEPGIAAVIPPDLDRCNCASVMIVRRSTTFDSHWMSYAFNSQVLKAQVDVVKYGAAQKQFNISHAVDFWFPVPPLKEQRAMVRELDDATASIDRLIHRIHDGIETLNEYRTGLKSAAVTGQIDIREQPE